MSVSPSVVWVRVLADGAPDTAVFVSNVAVDKRSKAITRKPDPPFPPVAPAPAPPPPPPRFAEAATPFAPLRPPVPASLVPPVPAVPVPQTPPPPPAPYVVLLPAIFEVMPATPLQAFEF